MIALRTQHSDFEPIFVVGCPRSGTTLLTVLLDRHSELAMTPETHFVEHKLGAHHDGLPKGPVSHDVLTDFFLNHTHLFDLGLEVDEVVRRFRHEEPTFEGFFRRALEAYGAKAGKARVGEKSPEHIFHIDTLLGWYPRARIVWLLRDGRDTVQAIVRNSVFHDSRRRASHLWHSTVKAGLRAERKYPGNVHRVKFEDLIHDPRGELGRICTFLGLEMEESQLDPRSRSGVVLDKERDYKDRANQGFDPRKIGEYAAQTDERAKWLMDSVMARSLTKVGYPKTEVRSAGLLECAKNAAINLPLYGAYHPRFVRTKLQLARVGRRLAARRRRRHESLETVSTEERASGSQLEETKAGGVLQTAQSAG